MKGPESGTAEVTCQSDQGGVITGGGGFSTYYSQPDWQSSVVANYFNTVEGTVNAPVSGFNTIGRGYPDVALAGTSYMVTVNSIMVSVSGTSASCPVFAGMVSLVNAARLGDGKPSLGFLNPVLYSGYTSFANDIVSGSNKCPAISGTCCMEGFNAASGWDPATGLGSIDFSKFMTALSTYPATPKEPLSPEEIKTPTSLPATIMPSLRPSKKPMSTPASPVHEGRAHSSPHRISSSTTACSDHPPTFKPTTKCHKIHA